LTVSASRRKTVDRIVHALLPLLGVALIPAFAAKAYSETPVDVIPHQEETVAPYVARVYFDPKAKDGSDSYFEIVKDGQRVYLQKARTKGEKFFIGTMYKDDPDASLVKMGMPITGDTQPDLVISEFTGHANCCLVLHIFEIGPTFKKLGTIDSEFGDSGPHILHPDQDSKSTGLAVQIHDWTFANWNTDFADSPAPKVMLQFSGGAYRVAPELMRTPEIAASDLATRAAAIRDYAPSAKGGTWPHAEVSPQLWATMLDLIYGGHADDAWKFLDDAWPPKVQGKDVFARDFRAQLAQSSYWPAVEAMNSSKPAAGKSDQSASLSPTAAK
jgi:hypothetical protein